MTKKVTNFDHLPAMLRMKDLQDTLGICRAKAYELAHAEGFPVIKIGRNFLVPKSSFLCWIEGQLGTKVEENTARQRS